jgi:hypothetical protein
MELAVSRNEGRRWRIALHALDACGRGVRRYTRACIGG